MKVLKNPIFLQFFFYKTIQYAEKEIIDSILQDYLICNGFELEPLCYYDWRDYGYFMKIFKIQQIIYIMME